MEVIFDHFHLSLLILILYIVTFLQTEAISGHYLISFKMFHKDQNNFPNFQKIINLLKIINLSLRNRFVHLLKEQVRNSTLLINLLFDVFLVAIKFEIDILNL